MASLITQRQRGGMKTKRHRKWGQAGSHQFGETESKLLDWLGGSFSRFTDSNKPDLYRLVLFPGLSPQRIEREFTRNKVLRENRMKEFGEN